MFCLITVTLYPLHFITLYPYTYLLPLPSKKNLQVLLFNMQLGYGLCLINESLLCISKDQWVKVNAMGEGKW